MRPEGSEIEESNPYTAFLGILGYVPEERTPFVRRHPLPSPLMVKILLRYGQQPLSRPFAVWTTGSTISVGSFTKPGLAVSR